MRAPLDLTRAFLVLCAFLSVTFMPAAWGSTSQTLAAGKAQTNLQTESVWPGAQDPPYICCWDQQGQYVTFSFTVPGGPATLTLRYSAGSGAGTRKIELDGTTWVADQVFLRTPNWST